jgi:hypothetical protein
MRIDREQHLRGILSWEAETSFRLRARTMERGAAGFSESSQLVDPAGSLVDAEPHRFVSLVVEEGDVSKRHRVRWEREVGGVVQTLVYESVHRDPHVLRHVPDYGTYHRLVVSTPYVDWDQDAVLRSTGVLVRFIVGTVEGERVTPFDRVELAGGQVSVEGGGAGTAEAEGRFIEIVAAGEDPAAAESRARTVLGLVALCLGEQAVGEEVFSETWEVTKAGQLGAIDIPVRVPIPASRSPPNSTPSSRA